MNTGHTSPADASSRLPFRTKLAYGVGDLGGNLYFTIMGTFLFSFCTEVLGLGPGYVGVALAIGRVVDAVTDPAVGILSDRVDTRFGHRKPFMFSGAMLILPLMLAMFSTPGLGSPLALAIWVAVVYSLMNTAYTLQNVPYSALVPELTSDFHERTNINGFRNIFAVLGTLTAFAGVTLLTAGNAPSSWFRMGTITGVVMMLTFLVPTLFVPKTHKVSMVTHEKGVFKDYLTTLTMKEFLLISVPWMLHLTGITVIMQNVPYYFTYVIGRPESQIFALASMLGGAIVAIPLWVMISRHIGKKRSYNAGMAIFAASVLVFFFLGHRLGMGYIVAAMAIAGLGFGAQYVMPYSILADVIEADYDRGGRRREGIFMGQFTFISKVGQALAALVTGAVLRLAGFRQPLVAGGELFAQTPGTLVAIRALIGPISALFFVSGIVVLSFYPITEQVYREIRRRIEAREAQATASDPVSPQE
jgi:glycoside/pentoside/hexuronide:cation symporter, GPH family